VIAAGSKVAKTSSPDRSGQSFRRGAKAPPLVEDERDEDKTDG